MVTIYGPGSENAPLTLKCVVENKTASFCGALCGVQAVGVCSWCQCVFPLKISLRVIFLHKMASTLFSKAVLSFGTSWTSQVTLHFPSFSSALTEIS